MVQKVYKVGWSPYDGMVMKGFPAHVIAGGEIAVQDYQFVKKVKAGSCISSHHSFRKKLF